MPMLLDTSVLVRLRDRDSPDHAACVALLNALANKPHGAVLCAQVLIEYWVVPTRPTSSNGLGLSPADADNDLSRFLQLVSCLPEPPDVLAGWRRLVASSATRGRPAHDARLVAVMDAYEITELITLNAAHFQRFPHVRCLAPAEVLASGPSSPDTAG